MAAKKNRKTPNFTRRALLALSGGAVLSVCGWVWWRRWDAIVVHHSAGGRGDLDLLSRVHDERQYLDPVKMVPYHFVIGNGRGIAMGEIVPTKRWTFRIWGAHVRKTARMRNMSGIGICLIGNFQNDTVPEVQYDALIAHIRVLRDRFDIPVENITLHRDTQKQMTVCPGKNFPRERFYIDVAL